MVEVTQIQKLHNKSIAQIIRSSLEEFDIDLAGTVYVDPYLDDMYSHFTVPAKVYFIAIDNNEVIGGSGIAPLDDTSTEVCELQRMFVTKRSRGKGVGKMLMDACLKQAKDMGFKQCYLETLAPMKDAIKLYERTGFKYLDAPMGNTGHYSCQTWMTINL